MTGRAGEVDVQDVTRLFRRFVDESNRDGQVAARPTRQDGVERHARLERRQPHLVRFRRCVAQAGDRHVEHGRTGRLINMHSCGSIRDTATEHEEMRRRRIDSR